MVKFSIIIPVKEINDYVRETVPHILALDRDEWELIVLTNEVCTNEWEDARIKFVTSGKVGPAAKRDLGAKFAVGEILVFLDDDSYPNTDLLSIASPFFDDEAVVAVGGPAITPPDDTFWQKVSGAVFLSKFSGGNPERYIPMGGIKEVDDWPSVNLMVRRKDFLAIGGFNSPYWPGEDTKLCNDLKKATSKKILYIPELIVWHHRRGGLLRHLKQVGAYGLHRGYFFKVYPENSRKLKYLVPSLFVLFCFANLVNLLHPMFSKNMFVAGWVIYYLFIMRALYDIIKYETLHVGICSMIYILFTHLVYGFRFIEGLMTRRLESKLR